MTVDKFRQATEQYQRSILIKIGWAALLGVVTTAASMVLATALDLARWFGEPAEEILVGISPFPGILMFIGLVWFWERRLLLDSQLRCPHCEKSIAQLKHLVIATRNCPFCGLKILEEPVASTHQRVDLET